MIRAAAVLIVALLLSLSGSRPATAGTPAAPAATAATEVSGPVARTRAFRLPPRTEYVALHWRGARAAIVHVAFRRGRGQFGRRRAVALDEVGLQRSDGETYGTLTGAAGADAVRVWTDRPLRRLTVLALRDRGEPPAARSTATAATATSTTTGPGAPAVISRAGWGADESLRFDASGNEIWPPAFWPVQKLIVHHTAGRNGDPDPAATIRSIYYYHAVTQGWGDIGYNFLVDEAGNVYEGRHARLYPAGETPTGEDEAGHGVTAAHAAGFNSGTVGVALLGTLTRTEPTAPARDALERFLAWKAAGHGIDPLATAPYTNPVNSTQATFPNIAGHREVGATECPGEAFFALLPSVRSAVVDRVNAAAAYPRPAAAGPLRVSLVPAYQACTDGSGSHAPPLAFPSCPPRPVSSRLTVGTPDANGYRAASVGTVRLRIVPGDPATPADEADVALWASVTDVRNAADLSRYGGELQLSLGLRITDRQSGASLVDPATVEDASVSAALPCTDGTCELATSLDALLPGSVKERVRAIWEVDRVAVMDGGEDGSAATPDGDLFATQGVFVP